MRNTLLKKSNEKCLELGRDLKECVLNHIAQAARAVPGSSKEQYHVNSIVHLSNEVPTVGCLIEDLRDALIKHFEDVS